MADYEKLSSFIIEHVGGKENIKNVTHCMTRLRFKLVDEEKTNEEALKNNKEIVTAQQSGGRYQVVIGTHVGDVCEEILRQLGTGEIVQKDDREAGSLLNRFTATITQTMVPVLGVLGACGLIAAIMAVLVATRMIDTQSGTYLLLNAMGNACLTFFPILLGYTSAKAFRMNPFVGMILGCILVFPSLSDSINSGDALYTVFADSSFAMPVYKTFFGIPIMFPVNGYTSTVIPIIFATYFASKVEGVFERIVPQAAKMYFVPMFTILIAATVSLLLIGPVSIILTNLISVIITVLLEKSPILAFAVIALVYQPLVVLGLHWALISVGMIEFMTSGNSLIVSLIFPASFAHLAVCAAVYCRTKSTKMKETALPAVISACFCIIEPSIYGVTLSVKKRFGICMLAGTAGAIIEGLANAPMYAISMGVTGFAGFINPLTGDIKGMLMCILAVGVTVVLAFGMTWVTYRPEDDGVSSEQMGGRNRKKEIIFSPMKGQTKALSGMQDPVFANETLGKGICICPEEGKVTAPCDGILNTVFPTGHALGITSDGGAEVLIHIGTNTVQLPKGTFHKEKAQGMRIKKGDLLVTFSLEEIKKQGYDTETAVIITNQSDYLDVINICGREVTYCDELIAAVVAETVPTAILEHA